MRVNANQVRPHAAGRRGAASVPTLEWLRSDTAGRKAYQTRLKRGHRMKPRERHHRPGFRRSRGAISTGNMEIARPRPDAMAAGRDGSCR